MASKWYVCDAGASAKSLMAATRMLHPGADVVCEANPLRIRSQVGSSSRHEASVVVGPHVEGLTPVNVAAALVADGMVDEVVLAAESPCGSLRSRAARAGIARVLDLSELPTWCTSVGAGQIQPAKGQPRPTKHQLSADVFADLDEPDGLGSASLLPSGEARKTLGGLPQAEKLSPTSVRSLARLDNAGRSSWQAKKGIPVVVVASGRGGVGKTTLVGTMAASLASWGMKVAVVDLDLAQGNVYSTFGAKGAPDLAQLYSEREPDAHDIESAAGSLAPNISVWGPCAMPESAELVAPHTTSLVSAVTCLADIVLVDTPATWSDGVAQAAQMADRLVLVSDARHSAITPVARAAALAVRLGVARTRIVRVSTYVDTHVSDEPLLHGADVGLEVARCFELPDGGRDLYELVDAGHVGELVEQGDDYAQGVAHICAKLLEELGALPDVDAARKALANPRKKSSRGLFARLRDVS